MSRSCAPKAASELERFAERAAKWLMAEKPIGLVMVLAVGDPATGRVATVAPDGAEACELLDAALRAHLGGAARVDGGEHGPQ